MDGRYIVFYVCILFYVLSNDVSIKLSVGEVDRNGSDQK